MHTKKGGCGILIRITRIRNPAMYDTENIRPEKAYDYAGLLVIWV